MGDTSSEVVELLSELRALRGRLSEPKPSRFTLRAAAWELSISLTTLNRLARAGLVRVRQENGRRFVPASEVARLSEPDEPRTRAPRGRRSEPYSASAEAAAARASKQG